MSCTESSEIPPDLRICWRNYCSQDSITSVLDTNQRGSETPPSVSLTTFSSHSESLVSQADSLTKLLTFRQSHEKSQTVSFNIHLSVMVCDIPPASCWWRHNKKTAQWDGLIVKWVMVRQSHDIYISVRQSHDIHLSVRQSHDIYVTGWLSGWYQEEITPRSLWLWGKLTGQQSPTHK